MTSKPLTQYTCILMEPKAASFADIIKITIMLINATLKVSIKVKRIRKKCIKMQFYLYFSI